MKSLQPNSLATAGLVFLLVVQVVAIGLLASVPPTSRDALTHHLAVPKHYLQQGGIKELPDLKFSYYPMNIDLLYMIPLYFGNDIIPKYIHFLFALLTAGLIHVYLKRRMGLLYGLLGALFFLTIPVIVKLSVTAYVDLGLVFFSFASLVMLLEWHRTGGRIRFLALSACFCGLALGTKYNGLVSFFLIFFFVILVGSYRKTEGRKPRILFPAALFAAIALSLFSPWMIRNMIWKQNPLFPLVNPARVFFQEAQQPSGKKPARGPAPLDPFSIRKHVFKESLLEIGLIPVRVFFQGEDDDPKHFDGKLSAFLLLLPMAGLLLRRSGPDRYHRIEDRIWWAFSVSYLLIVFAKTDMRIRYIAPVIPPLTILSIVALHRIGCGLRRYSFFTKGRRQAIVIGGVACVMIGWNLPYLYGHQMKTIRPFEYLSGKVTRDAYISRYRPEYPVMQYVNHNLPLDAKLLGLFLGNRRYYLERDIVFQTIYQLTVSSIERRNLSVAEINKKISRLGVTHLLVGWSLLQQWMRQHMDDQGRQTLALFLKTNTRLLFSKGGYVLLALR